jgi:PAS domain S-box-containing protein
MAELLRVLVVEDAESDLKMLLDELKRRDYSPAHIRVQTAAKMRAALRDHVWDIIISEYALPRFNALAALTVLQKSKLDLPFIVVSAAHGEEAAVDMMKAGASDFIIKNNLSRLAPAIEREMEAARNRHVKARAEAAMLHWAAVVENNEDAIYSKNLEGIIVSWNPAAERIFGYCANEIIGQSISLLFPKNKQDEFSDIMAGLGRSELIGFKKTYRQRKDGKNIPVSVSISPIKGTDGRVIGASTIAHDLTEPIQAEAERYKLIEDLTAALSHVKTLSGLLPICASCKNIRDDDGYWHQIEDYLKQHSDAKFSHAICPACQEKYHSQLPAEALPAKSFGGLGSRVAG